MSPIFSDILFALLIGGIISWMSTIKDPRMKAFVYILPFPITFVLLATGVVINGLNVIGLALVVVFLWLVYFLHDKARFPILIADIIAALVYITLGYLATKIPTPPFWATAGFYLVWWIIFVRSYRSPITKDQPSRSSIHPLQKFTVVSIVAFILLRLKSLLPGVVVTFPFGGVFAVVESRRTLRTLAAVVTRNTIALLVMFAVIAYAPHSFAPLLKLAIAWIALLITLRCIYWLKIGRV